MRKILFIVCLPIGISIAFFVSCSAEPDKIVEDAGTIHQINWQHFNTEAFLEAKNLDKLVFLEVGANWCHWCHVMDDSTYSDPKVQSYLNDHFILCREDQDARPDLYAAYKPWGWPAIIVLNAAGEELLKLRGYQQKKGFLKDLQAIVENPVVLSDRDANESTNFSASELELYTQFLSKIDHKKGGYNWNNKSLDVTGIQHALYYYLNTDSLKNWADLTVNNSYLLVDPVWSGVYQYSAKKSWNNQHYEKLLRKQAEYIVAYCQYGSISETKKPIEMAEGIFDYCNRFLGNETPLFWNSQNADLVSGVHSGEYYALSEKDRLKQGTPSVDKKIYLKENAAICLALTKLWAATGKNKYVIKGIAMLDYILDNYKNKSGVYSREKGQEKIISLDDNIKLIEALLVYYQITGNKKYVTESIAIGYGVMELFDSPKGLQSAAGELAITPVLVPKSNVEAVITFNQLGHLTKLDTFTNYATKIYSNLDKKELARSLATLPLLIRADKAIVNEPYHALLVSNGTVPNKDKYLAALLLHPDASFIFEELRFDEMTPADKAFYGSFDSGTLFMCTSSFCSAPIFSVSALDNFLKQNLGGFD